VPTVASAAVAGLVVVAAVARGLAGRDESPTTSTNTSTGASSGSTWWDGVDRRRLVLLAIVAFGLMLAEGTAYDWSALHVVGSYGTGEAIGAIAFGAFSATMTVSRFVIDPVVASVGAVRVVRVGALVGIVGMAIAIVSPVPALAVVGWAVFGVGLAGLIPQIFTAAGNLTDSAGGRTISIVVGCGYLGMLAGPAVVGFISSRTSLNTGLLAALAALLLAVCLAGVVRPPQRPVSALGEPRSSHPGGRATLEG
jgi:MFS family permease